MIAPRIARSVSGLLGRGCSRIGSRIGSGVAIAKANTSDKVRKKQRLYAAEKLFHCQYDLFFCVKSCSCGSVLFLASDLTAILINERVPTQLAKQAELNNHGRRPVESAVI